MPSAHSEFPASSATRLLACPASFAAGQAMASGPRRSSIFAAEGTLAHSLTEAILYSGVDPSSMIGRTYTADGHEFTPDDHFIDDCLVYVDFVEGMRALGFFVALETRVSPMVHWANKPLLGPMLFGTSDCIAYHPGTDEIVIADLKFGRGVAVEIAGNDQLLYYAAGSMALNIINGIRSRHGLAALPGGWLPSKVTTVVVQPRAYHPGGPIRAAVYTTQEVIDWAQGRLYDGVKAAITDKGTTFHAGSHCRWCPAMATCEERRKQLDDTATLVFAGAPLENIPMPDVLVSADDTTDTTTSVMPDFTLSDAALGTILDKIAILKPYIAAVEALGEERARSKPGSVPGWKSVPTRSRRVWAGDEDDVAAAFNNEGLQPGAYLETKLLSPAQVEKKLGKKAYQAIAQQHVVSASSGTKLVPESDPRERLQGRTAREAFGFLPAPTFPEVN